MPAVALPNFGNANPGGKGGALAKARSRYERHSGKAGSKSRTGRSECSQAVSDWKTTGLTKEISATLGRCRAAAHAKKQGDLHAAAGNELKGQALHHRATKEVVGKGARLAKAKELLAARKAKAATASPVASPSAGQPMAKVKPTTAALIAQAKARQTGVGHVSKTGRTPNEFERDALTKSRHEYVADRVVAGTKTKAGREYTSNDGMVKTKEGYRPTFAGKTLGHYSPMDAAGAHEHARRNYANRIVAQAEQDRIIAHTEFRPTPGRNTPDRVALARKLKRERDDRVIPPAPAAAPAPVATPHVTSPVTGHTAAHHRAEASKHEDIAAGHGKTVRHFETFVGKGKAATAHQRAVYDKAKSKQIESRREAAFHHGQANAIEGKAASAVVAPSVASVPTVPAPVAAREPNPILLAQAAAHRATKGSPLERARRLLPTAASHAHKATARASLASRDAGGDNKQMTSTNYSPTGPLGDAARRTAYERRAAEQRQYRLRDIASGRPVAAKVAAKAPEPAKVPTPRSVHEQLAEIPPSVQIGIQSAATHRIDTLQKLRQARYMATGTGAGGKESVDRSKLVEERQRLGLTAEQVRAKRVGTHETLKEFDKVAPANNVDPKAVVDHFREQRRSEIKGGQQMKFRGVGYYPSAAEAARASIAQRTSAAQAGDPMRYAMRAKKAADDMQRAVDQATRTAKSIRGGKARSIIEARRGLAVPKTVASGKPLLPHEVQKGEVVTVPSSSGPLPMRVDHLDKATRQRITGGVVKRNGKYHPVRDIPADRLQAIRARVAARKAVGVSR